MDEYSILFTGSLSKLTPMVRTFWCFQGFDSGGLDTLRPFYHLRTSTGGLIIVKTSKNKHSVPFLTHIQAVNSRQNIPDIAQDCGWVDLRWSEMTWQHHWNFLSKSRDGTLAFQHVFWVEFWQFNFFLTETETQATQRIRITQYQTAPIWGNPVCHTQ